MENINDLRSIFSYINHLGIFFDKNEFTYQLESHPDFPSLLSLSDTMNFFGIEHKMLKISKTEIEKLPDHFMALVQNKTNEKFAFIKKKKDSYLIDREKFSKIEAKNIFQGIYLIAQNKNSLKNVGENKNQNELFKYLFLFICLIIILQLITSRVNFTYLSILISSTIGVILSLEIFRQSIGKFSVLSGLCSINISSDCLKVTSSKKWKFLNFLGFDDISIAFFISQFLILLLFLPSSEIYNLLQIYTIGLWLSIPISILSIYYQWFVVKKWCPICMCIIGILYFQLIILNNFTEKKSFFVYQYFILVLLIISIVFLIWNQFKKLILGNDELNKKLTRKMKVSKNSFLFQSALKTGIRYEFPISNGSIYHKSQSSKHNITLITSPHCGYCKNVHISLEKILKLILEDFDLHIIFNTSISNQDVFLFNHFHQYFKDNGFQKFHSYFLEYVLDKRINKLTIYEKENSINKDFFEILEIQREFCLNNDMFFTPMIFIDGKQYPEIFDIDDLLFFLLQMTEDENIEYQKV